MHLTMTAVSDLPGVAVEPAVRGDRGTYDPATRCVAEAAKVKKVAMGIALAVTMLAGHADGSDLCCDWVQAIPANQWFLCLF
ncbi:hypothetical protein GCM10023116_45790 [Kistimonas scapharcae]|uniref:Transposase n=1 Tax=Kistimonas scapharcae TaxID=1036133 RepID=A0ABP8VB93_9GAMM